MSTLDFDALSKEIGWMGKGELEQLYAIAQLSPNNRGIELGSFCGKSAVAIATALKEHQGILLCVDYFGGNVGYTPTGGTMMLVDSYKLFNEVIVRYDVSDTTTMLKGNIRHFLPALFGRFGFIFIDANHTYPELIQDAFWAYNNTVSGGYIIFHDYGNKVWTDVAPVVDVLKNLWKGTWEHFYSLAIFRKL